MQSYKYVGTKVSKVNVLERPAQRPGRSGIVDWFYKCGCECGETCFISQAEISAVARGRNKGPRVLSCGCHRSERVAKGALVDYRQSYKDAAKRRDYSFELSLPQFTALVESNCLYCGAAPGKPCMPYTNRLKRQAVRNESRAEEAPVPYRGSKDSYEAATAFLVNGVDRLDNSLGYTSTNAVTCCTACNRAKNALGLAEFTTWLIQIKSSPLPQVLLEYMALGTASKTAQPPTC